MINEKEEDGEQSPENKKKGPVEKKPFLTRGTGKAGGVGKPMELAKSLSMKRNSNKPDERETSPRLNNILGLTKQSKSATFSKPGSALGEAPLTLKRQNQPKQETQADFYEIAAMTQPQKQDYLDRQIKIYNYENQKVA
jgi:hypothetical protein